MATADLVIAVENPRAADLDELFARHHDFCHADTPPESIHMLPRAALDAPDTTFLVARRAGKPVGMGALKAFGEAAGEIKSMHVLTQERGHGVAPALVVALLAHGRDRGMTQLYLETGSQPSFAAARKLYRSAGFTDCPPFGDYTDDPNSVYMTRILR